MSDTVTSAKMLFALLGRDPDEHVALCHQAPGGEFTTAMTTVGRLPDQAARMVEGRCIWYSVNPLRSGIPRGKRGSATDVVGLTALYEDLDVKEGGLPSWEACRAVIDDAADILGTPATAIVNSGHGLQPYWPISDARWDWADDEVRNEAASILQRWHQLMLMIAAKHGGGLDGCGNDIARVLRLPGTVNCKNNERVPVTVEYPAGARALTMAEIVKVLDLYNIPRTPIRLRGEKVSVHADWSWAEETCSYVRGMIKGWSEDRPHKRHNWLLSQATRLHAAHRNGCIAETDFDAAVDALEDAFSALIDDGVRPAQVGEFDNALRDMLVKAEAETDEEIADELGGHDHDGGPALLIDDTTGATPTPDVDPCTVEQAVKRFRGWLGESYDTDSMLVTAAAAVVQRMMGDPLWLLIVSGSGNAKTETVNSLSGAGAKAISTLTGGAALLSATGKRDRAKNATGGLLREFPNGVLVIKDVTSILSMRHEARGELIGALREVYDGQWTRGFGADGGNTLEWSGRITVVGAVTTAWDEHHAVIASCGDRFVLCRTDSNDERGRKASARKALSNTGSEKQMRAELAATVGGLVAGADLDVADTPDEVTDEIMSLADVATVMRTAVISDYRGDVIDVHAQEAPTRFAKQLLQLHRGLLAIGVDPQHSMRIVRRIAVDSMPPDRVAAMRAVLARPDSTSYRLALDLDKPRNSVDRSLQRLNAVGLVSVVKSDYDDAHGFTSQRHDAWRWTPSTRWRDEVTAVLQVRPEKSHPLFSDGERDGERVSNEREEQESFPDEQKCRSGAQPETNEDRSGASGRGLPCVICAVRNACTDAGHCYSCMTASAAS